MRWGAQVVHVALKDLRHSGWQLLAFGAVVAVATAAAVGWRPLESIGPFLLVVLTVLGMVLVAALVQADSPARSDAFWATRPLSPSAVFAAKLVLAAVVLVGLPLLGQLAAVLSYDVPARMVPAQLGHTVVTYSGWLGLAAVVAAMTPDFRTFLAALTLLVVIEVVSIAVTTSLRLGIMDGIEPNVTLLKAAVVCGMALVVARQYRHRNVRRGIAWGAALALVAPTLFMVPPQPARAAAPGLVPSELRATVLEVEAVQVRRNPNGGARIQLRLRIEPGAGVVKYTLVRPVLELARRDTVERIERDGTVSTIFSARFVETVPYRWLNAREARVYPHVSFDLSPAQAEAVLRREARLVLHGEIGVADERVVVAAPLTAGARGTSGGFRLDVDRITSTSDGPSVDVRIASALGRARSYSPFVGTDYVWALVNEGRGEALEVTSSGRSASTIPLVLPGHGATASRLKLGLIDPRWRQPERVPDAEWLEDARLQLMRRVSRGTYGFRLEVGATVPVELAAQQPSQ